MIDLSSQSLSETAAALRSGGTSATALVGSALERRDAWLGAYKLLDPGGALESARRADVMLARDVPAPPLCGVPVSVKDLYGVAGLPTYAGTARRLPERWSRDAWLVSRLRQQGAAFVGKTHTVELAYGAVGINPHWGTPRNPWDPRVHRIPGGSSCGAGVSLWEGSALVALGSDTGGSIRIPASMTGAVGLRTTTGRWPTEGVVPLSSTLDTVGALTRSVPDAAYVFGAVDPAWGEPGALLAHLETLGAEPPRVAVPACDVWRACQPDIAARLRETIDALASAGWRVEETDGSLLDEAAELYLEGSLAGAECRAFLERDLPGWLEILHPTVGRRLAAAPATTSTAYRDALAARRGLKARAAELFDGAEVLALPTALLTPPAVAELDDLDRYLDTNRTALRPTAPASVLNLCALTLPAGLDDAGMPVGLQLLAPGGADEALLAWGLVAERVLGDRIGPGGGTRAG